VRRASELQINDFVILELTSNSNTVERELEKYPDTLTSQYYTDSYIDKNLLNKIIKKHSIDHVVLGTDPEHHFLYLEFLIKKSLNILMDKPIVAINNAVSQRVAAREIHRAFRKLDKAYASYSDANVTILSQRRYHPGYRKIQQDLIENYIKTGIVPHYFYLLHSDGQLRFLEEIDKISYHGFNHGYGKVSHSGYHFIDTLYVYLKNFLNSNEIDNYSVDCHHLTPYDYSQQISSSSIEKIFNEVAVPYAATATGEIDAYVTIQFKKGDRLVSSARIDMLHSGFSDRVSFESNKSDLYKGNGRIRHEKQIVLQGPIYAAYIDSLQSKQIDLTLKENALSDVGGEHHFDLIRFNHSLNGKEVIDETNITEIMDVTDHGFSRGHQEEARFYCLDDFFNSTSKRQRSQISDLSDHFFSSLMMSKIYEAMATGSRVSGEF
jgi:hypothetical protein